MSIFELYFVLFNFIIIYQQIVWLEWVIFEGLIVVIDYDSGVFFGLDYDRQIESGLVWCKVLFIGGKEINIGV